MPLRVVFAEDNYLVREGTAALLATADEVELVGTAAAWTSCSPRSTNTCPTPCSPTSGCRPAGPTRGSEAAQADPASHPDIGVVVLSQFAEEEYAYDLLKDGAAGLGYLLKERVADVEELVRALTEVARGGSVLDPKIVEALVAAKEHLAHSPLARLTDREREVLGHMAQGQNNAAIAKSLFLTERAVEKHINSLFHKLGPDRGARRAPPGDGGARLPPRSVVARPLSRPHQSRIVTALSACRRCRRCRARAGARGSERSRGRAIGIPGSPGSRARSSRP